MITPDCRFGLYLNRHRQIERAAWGVMLGGDASRGHPTKDLFVAIHDDEDEGVAAHTLYQTKCELAKKPADFAGDV